MTEKRAVLDGTARFFYGKITTKDVIPMTYRDRMIAAGVRPDCVVETLEWFRTQGDDTFLERYVTGIETRKNLEVSEK